MIGWPTIVEPIETFWGKAGCGALVCKLGILGTWRFVRAGAPPEIDICG